MGKKETKIEKLERARNNLEEARKAFNKAQANLFVSASVYNEAVKELLAVPVIDEK